MLTSLLYGPICLALLAMTGLIVLLVYYFAAFRSGKEYEYSSPLTAMWAGIGTMWFATCFLAWWKLSKRTGLAATTAWALFGALFGLEGFVALVGWAIAENEGAASGLSVLWVVTGGLVFLMSLDLRRNKSHEDFPPSGEIRRCRCCTCQFWIDLVSLWMVAVLMIFSSGYMIQACQSAADKQSLTPPGEIYSLNVNGANMKMHMYCFGDGDRTAILEHGGGSNSVSLLALAGGLESNYGYRVCVYDRLGYGFTPTYYSQSGPTGGPDRPLANSGVLLSRLLDVAGESGPFICAGHSAGAEACLWLAHERNSDVQGIVMIDGYPDIIGAGSLRPTEDGNDSVLTISKTFAVLIGATGLTRGLVGNPGPNFVPRREKSTMTKLYGQARFWFSQYWDVKSASTLDEASQLHVNLNATRDEEGLYVYGGTLTGVKVLVLPADSTVTEVDCDDPQNSDEYCCGHAQGSELCENISFDKSLYRKQNDLYAATLSNDTPGVVITGPKGSGHDFVYHKDYYEWIVDRIGAEFMT